MWIDTHAHFDDFEAAGTVEAVLQRAREAGVGQVVAIGGRDASNRLAADLAGRYPGTVYAACGYDRDQAGAPVDTAALDEILARPDVVAVGEMGLDYHYHADTAPAQRALFEAMADAARRFGRPLVIHSREADEDTLDLLRDHLRAWKGDAGRVGVLHCFTGSPAFARKLLDLGLMLSLSGIATFLRGENVRAIAAFAPADRLLLETDAPYLAPIPHRGETNEPAFLVETARRVAEVRGCSMEALAEQTSANARRLFGWT